MNRTLKKISPLFFILSLAGCGLFEDRYDPLEAGEHLYLMDSFYFTESDNSQLYWSTWGTVDREDLTVDVDVPPSLDMTTESLTANITIENAGLGEDSYWYTTTDPIVWNYTYDYKVSRHDFDTDWTGEAIYEVTFRIKFNPALLSSLSVYNDSTTNWSSSGTYYSSTADFELALSFNDDVDPTDLGSAAFIAGLTGSNGNLSSLTETSFSPNLTGTANYYQFTLTAPSEGTVTAQFSGGSVTDSSEGLSNESSNQVQMVYDSTAPTPSSDSLTIETNETVPDSLDEFFLDIDIPEASDNIISQGNIQYMIVFSDTESDVSDLTLIDSSLYSSVWSLEYWSTHSEDFYREYINFPYELQTFLSSATSGTDITLYFNLLAKDYSYPGNMDELYYLYGEGNISLHSTTPISVTFTVP